VAEEQTIEQILAAMPPDQRRKFLSNATFLNNSRMLNQNQQAIAGIQAPPKPYNYEKPEGVGGTLKNIGTNLFRPVLERAGLAPSIEGRLANMQYNKFLRESYLSSNELVRENMGRNYLLNRGNDPKQVGAMSGDELRQTVADVVGVNQRDKFGTSFQIKEGTGERIYGPAASSEIQQYLVDNPNFFNPPTSTEGAAGLTDAQQAVVDNIPSFSEYSRRNEAFSETNKLAAKANDSRGQEYVKLSGDAYGQRNTLEHMFALLQDPEFDSGTGQAFLTKIQSLGYNLGLTNKSPKKEEIFQALTRAIIIPMVKSLGVNPTDKDFEIIESASAGLNQTKAGNLLLLQARKISNERKIMVADAYQNFSKENFEMKASQPLRFEANWELTLSEMKKSPEWQGQALSELNSAAKRITGNETGKFSLDDIGASFAGEGP